MTEKAVWDAIVSRLTTALAGAYPALVTTYSFEDAVSIYQTGVAWLLVTPHKHDFVPHPKADEWQFLIQFSKSLMPGAQATTTAAAEADRDLRVAVLDALNGDAGYVALRDAGLYSSECSGMPEDQMTEGMINPHIFSCLTI